MPENNKKRKQKKETKKKMKEKIKKLVLNDWKETLTMTS